MLFVCLWVVMACGHPALAVESPPGSIKKNPSSVKDLRQIQKRARSVIRQVAPATTAVICGGATGSAVIVSDDGYVLTAAHVSHKPGMAALFQFADGRLVSGESLGLNRRLDAGMMKITDDPPSGGWPHVKLGRLSTLDEGSWVIALGNPGGFDPARGLVARLGRILDLNDDLIISSCTLTAGDSGGPLLDMNGRLVGIHSRIGLSTTNNMHVPVTDFRKGWDRMRAGDRFGWDWLPRPQNAQPNPSTDQGDTDKPDRSK